MIDKKKVSKQMQTKYKAIQIVAEKHFEVSQFSFGG